MVRTTLGALRHLLRRSLSEGLADRFARAPVPILVHPPQEPKHIVAVSPEGGTSGYASVTGGRPTESGEPTWTIESVYADTPLVAMALFTAALGTWKNVRPSHSVSPAAQKVVRRYHDRHKNDPSRVTTSPHGFLKAVYHGTPEDEAATRAMLAAGVKTGADAAELVNAAGPGFSRAYGDPKRSGFELPNLDHVEGEALLGWVMRMIDNPNEHISSRARAWFESNKAKVGRALETEGGAMDSSWDSIMNEYHKTETAEELRRLAR